MRKGDRGEGVKILQAGLTRAGFCLVADGIYGPLTERAVRLFQQSRGLPVTGVVDTATLMALQPPVVPKPKPAPETGRPVLRTVERRLDLAKQWSTQKAKYILGEGGRSPHAPNPFTPDSKGRLGADCIGWVLWALGVDRYQPKLFTYYDGWMNTDSIIQDAKTGIGGGLWELVDKPEPGCLVVFPSIWKNGKRARMGHTGLVTAVPAEWSYTSASERVELLKLVEVVDCNASWRRRLSGKAIGRITAADLWNKPDAVFVRWVE